MIKLSENEIKVEQVFLSGINWDECENLIKMNDFMDVCGEENINSSNFEEFSPENRPEQKNKKYTLVMWNDEKALQFINVYKSATALWNPNDENYFRKCERNSKWEEISDVMQEDVELCKRKMISLMASYRREKCRIRNTQARGKTYISRWFAYDALQFLSARRNNQMVSETGDESIAEITDTESIEHKTPQHTAPPTRTPRVNKLKNKTETTDETKSIASQLKTKKKKCKSIVLKKSTRPTDNEIKYFLYFIGAKIKKYPSSIKIRTQQAIMNIMFKADQDLANRRHHNSKASKSHKSPSKSSSPAPSLTNDSLSYNSSSECEDSTTPKNSE